MKKKVKIMSFLLVAFMCFTLTTTFVFAAGPGAGTETSGTEKTTPNNDESGNGDTLRDQTRLMDQTCSSLKEQLAGLESSCDELQKQYEEAVKQQNEGEAQLLMEKLQLMGQEKEDCISQLKQIRDQLRETIRTSYTEEEMKRIKAVEMEIKQNYPDDRVIPVENVVPHGFTIKFDTPPVVRDGRTLVPVRALTEGLGATVAWNEKESTVSIEKEGIKIELRLRERVALVNGEEITLDVPPETINNRTVVPLRFILQQFGYDVNWDDESGIIEISSPEL